MTTRLYEIEGLLGNRFSISPHPKGGLLLEEEIRNWKKMGIKAVVSMLTCDEESELELSEESALCQKHGIEFLNFPIKDDVPNSKSKTVEFVNSLHELSKRMSKIHFHCRGGVGRSSMILFLLSAKYGVSPEACFSKISQSRGEKAPETEFQKKWVLELTGKQNHTIMR